MQAGTYFHGGLYSCLKLREIHPDARVVLALPDVPRYRTMAGAIAGSPRATRTDVWFLAEDGS